MSLKALCIFLLLIVVIVAVSAAPSEHEAVLETAPAEALRVRAVPAGQAAGQLAGQAAGRAGCTDSGCYSLCRALGWTGGYCLDADWCLCYR